MPDNAYEALCLHLKTQGLVVCRWYVNIYRGG